MQLILSSGELHDVILYHVRVNIRTKIQTVVHASCGLPDRDTSVYIEVGKPIPKLVPNVDAYVVWKNQEPLLIS